MKELQKTADIEKVLDLNYRNIHLILLPIFSDLLFTSLLSQIAFLQKQSYTTRTAAIEHVCRGTKDWLSQSSHKATVFKLILVIESRYQSCSNSRDRFSQETDVQTETNQPQSTAKMTPHLCNNTGWSHTNSHTK